MKDPVKKAQGSRGQRSKSSLLSKASPTKQPSDPQKKRPESHLLDPPPNSLKNRPLTLEEQVPGLGPSNPLPETYPTEEDKSLSPQTNPSGAPSASVEEGPRFTLEPEEEEFPLKEDKDSEIDRLTQLVDGLANHMAVLMKKVAEHDQLATMANAMLGGQAAFPSQGSAQPTTGDQPAQESGPADRYLPYLDRLIQFMQLSGGSAQPAAQQQTGGLEQVQGLLKGVFDMVDSVNKRATETSLSSLEMYAKRIPKMFNPGQDNGK